MRILLGFLCLVMAAMGCASRQMRETTPDTVAMVDLERYMGKWYEIASFPNWFQRGCLCTTAEYVMKDDYVEVKNSCRKDSTVGALSVASGKAYPVPGSNNSRLKVQFFWPFKGDYWIIALDKDYRHAVVGHPGKKYLWILSRTPQMSDATYEDLVELARSKGYDVARLKRTDQSCTP